MAIRTSSQTEQLDEAFAKAQAKFEAAVKANTNPAFRSKYADVSSIIDATLQHLNSEGIGVSQHPSLEYKTVGEGAEAYVTVTTRLKYKGQWEESELSLPAIQRDRFDAQSCGSALTYACRYALQGIFVVRREDDDANAATGRGTHEEAQAIGKAKVEALKNKMREPDQPLSNPEELSLFYLWNDDNQTAEIKGPDVLLKLHKPYLKQFWNPTSRSLVVNADQLEAMKYEMEQRKVQFLPLKPR